jgi:hypothetical protein
VQAGDEDRQRLGGPLPLDPLGLLELDPEGAGEHEVEVVTAAGAVVEAHQLPAPLSKDFEVMIISAASAASGTLAPT